MTGPVELVKRWPCLMLLVVQLAGVVLYPFMEGSYAGRAAFAVFGLLVLSLTVAALRVTPALTWVGALIALPCAVLLIASIITGDQRLFPWSAGFEMVLYAYAGLSMLAYMLRDDRVSTDEWFAIPAVFTLFAWAFAYLFVVIQALDTGAFGAHSNWMGLLFLSFTTLSSTGLSDIVPLTGHARSVVMLEQVAGVFYIAMVVTRLVSMSATRRRA
ncbi:MAG: ion channel [Nocardioidaceae bacterium]